MRTLTILLLIIFIVYNLTKNVENFSNNKKIIIIGNGPSVLNNENGKLIDSFDKVVRFNTFKNDSEYSKFVGTRTDLWFINAKNIRTRSPEIIKMMDDVGRLDKRVGNLQGHFNSAVNDIKDIRVSTDKILQKGARIDALHFQDDSPVSELSPDSQPPKAHLEDDT